MLLSTAIGAWDRLPVGCAVLVIVLLSLLLWAILWILLWPCSAPKGCRLDTQLVTALPCEFWPPRGWRSYGDLVIASVCGDVRR